MLGTEHNMVPGLHLAVGGKLFCQYFSLLTRSPEPEDRVLHGDTMAPYWSNFDEAYDEFENPIVVLLYIILSP